MNKFQRRIVFFSLLALLASAVVGCAAIGDHFVANQKTSVISDWDASSITKPTCDIEAGAEVEVVGFMTLNRPSGGETVIQLKAVDGSCTGTISDLNDFTRVEKK